MLERVAKSRMEIDSARLVILNAAIIIDELGGKAALKEIAEAKVQSASVLLNVVDRAIQAYGAAGVSQDTPLAALWAHARTMRIVDGPDEVHMLQLGRNESKRGDTLRAKIETQKVKAAQLFRRYHLEQVDSLELNRTPAKAYL
jgi:acyl-CoA dehydrogenase